MAIIQGTTGNDILTGGTGDDWAKPTLRERTIGAAGDDTISGGSSGNDFANTCQT
jgi:Ca2+-binding RTX toxin-like protein